MSRSIERDVRERDERTPSRSDGHDKNRCEPREPSAARQRNDVARLRDTINRVAQDRPTMPELIDRLERYGIRAVPNLQKSGRLNGMSYEVNGVRIKGS